MNKLLNRLRKSAGERMILSGYDTNPKVAKNGKLGVATAVLHLAPGNMSGHEVCPKRSPGCTAACLHFAGSPAYMSGKTTARIRKTKLLFRDRNLFMNILALEINDHLSRAANDNMEPAVRLNATSDIVWERKKFILFPEVAAELQRQGNDIISLFPTTQFYDYTKICSRDVPENYHLTFSMSETNLIDVKMEVSRGRNIAVVFEKHLPTHFMGLPVINGDEHDYRPADETQVVVGLKAKGVKGRADSSGFVNLVSTSIPGIALAA